MLHCRFNRKFLTLWSIAFTGHSSQFTHEMLLWNELNYYNRMYTMCAKSQISNVIAIPIRPWLYADSPRIIKRQMQLFISTHWISISSRITDLHVHICASVCGLKIHSIVNIRRENPKTTVWNDYLRKEKNMLITVRSTPIDKHARHFRSRLLLISHHYFHIY